MIRVHPLRALAVAALVAVASPLAPGAIADPPAPFEWGGAETFVPGTAAYADGEWAYTDYVYDDEGATGAFDYPEGTAGNEADIAIVRIALDGDVVRYRFDLNTLLVPDSTVVALAVDTDCDATTGAAEWPYAADVSTPGWDHVVTAWGTGGTVTAADGTTTDVPVTVDVDANTIDIEVARSVVNPVSRAWCYRGGSGLWDATTSTWAEQGDETQPDIINLLFRNRLHDGGTDATDENSSGGFQVQKQAAALTSGDLTPFVRAVDFDLLARGENVAPPEVTEDHNFTRIYASAAFPNARPEGISSSGVQNFLYNGRYQPYILFVPATYWAGLPEPAPMAPMLHGWRGNHRSFNPSADGAFWQKVVRPNRMLVAKALGRGQEVWYEHLGELDTLEIIEDVKRHYAIDDDRVFLGGTSMGGLGTIKIASAHPDVFAGVFPSVPPMSDRAQGYALPQNNDWDLTTMVPSFRNVPVRNFTGTYDALVPAGNDSRRFCDALRALVYDHDCWRDLHPSTGTHQGFEDERADQIAELLATHRRVVDPDRVTYASHPAFRAQAANVGISHLLPYDHAYWVSGIEWTEVPDDPGCQLQGSPSCTESPGIPDFPTDGGTPRRLVSGDGVSTIDVRTFGRGGGDPVATEIEDDPSPTLVREGLVLTPGELVEERNAFSLAVVGVLGLDLDLARMALTFSEPLTAELVGDGDLALGLVGEGAGTCTATLDGEPVPASHDGERVVFELTLTEDPAELVVSC